MSEQMEASVSIFDEETLTSDLMGEVLIRAGAWASAQPSSTAGEASNAEPQRICAWSVCRAWRDCLRRQPPLDHLARLLLEVHGPDQALLRAVRCTSVAVDRCDLIRAVLALPNVRADCMDGEALIEAAQLGHVDAVRLLLGWNEHAPRANCREGRALVQAAAGGHEAIVRLLLEWREHAPRADCRGGIALVAAALQGHEGAVRLLLDWREHAPRADSWHGEALVQAAGEGHEAIVRLLLGWKMHAPRADCQRGRPLWLATARGHEQVVRYLEEALKQLQAV